MANVSMKRRTIGALFWKLMERVGSQVVALVVQVVLARLLTPYDFGLLAYIVIFVNVGNVIVQSGLSTALVQFPEVDNEDFSTVFWMSFSISVCLYIAIFVSSPFIVQFLGEESLLWPLRVLCVVLVINAFNSIQVAKVLRNLETRILFVATVLSGVISGAAGICLAYYGAGIWALIVQQLAYQVVNCLVLLAQLRWVPRLVFHAARAKEMFSYGWKLLASGLLEAVYQSASDVVIGKLFSTSDLGLMTQGKRYPNALGSALDGAIQPVMLSAISRSQNDRAYAKRLVRRALKTSSYLIVPAMACLAVAAEPLVKLLLGEQWLPCVPIMQIYCFIFALLPIHTTNLQAINGMGRSDLFLKIEAIKKAIGVSILLFTAFVVKDVLAIVLGYAVSSVISSFVNARPNRILLNYGYREQMADIVPSFVLAGVAAIPASLILLTGLHPALTAVLQIGAFLAVYLGYSVVSKYEPFCYLLGTAKDLVFGSKSKSE